MHDLNNSELEYESEMNEFEDELEYEFEDEYEGEYEYEDEYESEYEYQLENEFEYENVFSEEEEMEYAAELLSTSDDQELEQFLGKLIRRAGKKVRKFARSSVGRRLRRGLRKVAKRALPMAGRAIGTAFGGPVGGAIGGRLARGAGRIFGLELEGLSPEDQEFEVARRVVRLAGNAAKQAAKAPTRANPDSVAKVAIVAAAKKDAPGLVSGSARHVLSTPSKGVRSGRWVRRGKKIVLMGV